MNKYDYARTVFSLQGLRVFSVLITIWTTIFIACTVVNLFTKEWDEYPAFFLIIFPPFYLVAFLIWKYSSRALNKVKDEARQPLNEDGTPKDISPAGRKKEKIQVLLIQLGIAIVIAAILGNFIFRQSQPRQQSSSMLHPPQQQTVGWATTWSTTPNPSHSIKKI